jgi:hypothetical protein
MSVAGRDSIWSHWKVPMGDYQSGQGNKVPLCPGIVHVATSSWLSTRHTNWTWEHRKPAGSLAQPPLRTGGNPKRARPAPPHHWAEAGHLGLCHASLESTSKLHVAHAVTHLFLLHATTPHHISVSSWKGAEENLGPEWQAALHNPLVLHSSGLLELPSGPASKDSKKVHPPRDTSSSVLWPLFPDKEMAWGKHPQISKQLLMI